jgi:hypothetical protein
MLSIAQRISRVVFPQSLRLRVHFFRKYQEYVFLKRKELGYGEDSLFSLHTAPFLQDEKFAHAYALGEQTGSWHGLSIRWRAYIACWLGQYVSKLPGDFVECGVNLGGLARAIVDYTDFDTLGKKFYLIDTYSGMVPEYLTSTEREKGLLEIYAYYKNNTKENVIKTFSDFSSVCIVQGAVPDVLSEVPTRKVAFLSLDMNCTMPEIKAAEFFWDKMCPGGVILLDDYAQTLHLEQRKAFDLFARERGVTVLCLPTSQGVIFKPLTAG